MAIAHALSDSTLDSNTGGNLSVTLPTGATSSHVVVLAASIGAGQTTGSFGTPSGWTLAGQIVNAANGGNHVTGQVFVALGNVANLTFSLTGNAATKGYRCVAFTGCDLTTPIDATGTANNTTTNVATLTTNLVTIATDQAWHLIGFFDWLGGTFSATNFTVSENAAANESAALLYNTTPKGTGSTGTVVVTSSAATTGQVLVGVPFALRPAASTTVIDEDEGLRYLPRWLW